MSFYDNIKIDSRQLPLSEKDIQRLRADGDTFQTKSLEGMYGVYEITADGYLEKTAASKTLGTDGRTCWQLVRMVDAHGFIVFYTDVDDEWFYFKARFRQGRVASIFRLKELPEIYSRTCTWELEIAVDELKPAYDAEIIQHELRLLDARERQHLDEEFANFDQQFPTV